MDEMIDAVDCYDVAKKAEIELPETAEQQKARTLEFLAKEKDAIDKLLETDKTDSATAMRTFNELAQKNTNNHKGEKYNILKAFRLQRGNAYTQKRSNIGCSSPPKLDYA